MKTKQQLNVECHEEMEETWEKTKDGKSVVMRMYEEEPETELKRPIKELRPLVKKIQHEIGFIKTQKIMDELEKEHPELFERITVKDFVERYQDKSTFQ